MDLRARTVRENATTGAGSLPPAVRSALAQVAGQADPHDVVADPLADLARTATIPGHLVVRLLSGTTYRTNGWTCRNSMVIYGNGSTIAAPTTSTNALITVNSGATLTLINVTCNIPIYSQGVVNLRSVSMSPAALVTPLGAYIELIGGGAGMSHLDDVVIGSVGALGIYMNAATSAIRLCACDTRLCTVGYEYWGPSGHALAACLGTSTVH